MIQPDYSKFFAESVKAAELKTTAETMIAEGEEVKKALSVSAKAFIAGKETVGDTTEIKAKVSFTFIYLAEEGYKKAEAVTDVSAVLPLNDPIITVSVDDVRALPVVGGYSARCSVLFSGVGLEKTEADALVGGDGITVKQASFELDSHVGACRDDYVIDDEFEVNFPVADVLSHTEEAYLTSVTSAVAAIVFEGEVAICFALTPFSENRDIVREKRVIPFRYEAECRGALPGGFARGGVEIKKVAVKVIADEGSGKSAISTEITLGFCGEAIERTEIALADDAFKNEAFLELEKKEINADKISGFYCHNKRISGVAQAELPSGGRLVAAVGERLGGVTVASDEDMLTVGGTLEADVIFRNSDNGTSVVKAETPFTLDIETGGKVDGVNVILTDFSAKMRGENVELEGNIRICYDLYEENKIRYIAEVTEGEARPVNDSAISVYVPSAGDGLWEVSKNLGVDGDEIMKYNKDITFPLTGNERILIYRRKV